MFQASTRLEHGCRDESKRPTTLPRGGTHAGTKTVHRTVSLASLVPCSRLILLSFQKQKHHPVGWCFVFGAGDEARTRYLDLGKVALYQMSYARMWHRPYSVSAMVPPVGVEPTTRGFSVRCSTN